MDLISSWAGSPEVRLVGETGSEVKVHRTLLGLYTDQWRQNLQGLASTDLVFILQGVGDQELEELANDIYKPLFDNGDEEVTKNDVESETGTDQESDKDERPGDNLTKIIGNQDDRENDLEEGEDIIIIEEHLVNEDGAVPSRDDDNTNVVGEFSFKEKKEKFLYYF